MSASSAHPLYAVPQIPGAMQLHLPRGEFPLSPPVSGPVAGQLSRSQQRMLVVRRAKAQTSHAAIEPSLTDHTHRGRPKSKYLHLSAEKESRLIDAFQEGDTMPKQFDANVLNQLTKTEEIE